MLLAFELLPLFGFALKSEQRKQQQQQRRRWWCSSNAKVLRIAAAYTPCEPAAASLTLITAERDISISKGAAGGTITRQQCKSHTGRSFVPHNSCKCRVDLLVVAHTTVI